MFGPVFPPLEENPEHEWRGEALLAHVQLVAEELRDNLERAERLSDQWTNIPIADALSDAAVSRCLARLSATGCLGEANRLPSSRLWNLLGVQLQHSWLVNRARTKPRGYAGDYELLEWISQNRVCDHPFGSALDRFFQRQAAPVAVRARADLIAAAIVGRMVDRPGQPLHVAGVGTGPAADFRLAVSMLPSEQRKHLQLTLLDIDPAAIDFAHDALSSWLPKENVCGRQINLMRLPKRSEELPATDFVVCPGLFDYLDDQAATDLLNLFWRRLRPGGLLMVGNFAPGHPTRAYMEWIGNWYLVYRTSNDLCNLAARAELPKDTWRVMAERSGIDLFLAAEKR